MLRNRLRCQERASFVELTQAILDTAIAQRVKSLDELKEISINGRAVADLITDETAKTGEKIELGRYEYLEAPSTTSYNHLGNKLSTIAGFNLEGVDYHVGRDIAMQVASMNPVAVDRDSVPEEVKNSEYNVAVEKTKEEQVKKAVEAALKKQASTPTSLTAKTTSPATSPKAGSPKKKQKKRVQSPPKQLLPRLQTSPNR